MKSNVYLLHSSRLVDNIIYNDILILILTTFNFIIIIIYIVTIIDPLLSGITDFLTAGISSNTLKAYERYWLLWKEFLINKRKGLCLINEYL
jgi:hypothetical protein